MSKLKLLNKHKNNSFVKGSVKDFAQWPDHPLFEVKMPAQDVLAISAAQLPPKREQKNDAGNKQYEQRNAAKTHVMTGL